MPRRILVTGAAGFVGSAVVRHLSPGAHGDLRLLAHRRTVAVPDGAELVRADMTSPDSLRGCCDDIDLVLHLATEISRDPTRCQAVNVQGTENLLAEAERAGVRDILYVSTAAVHGRGPHSDLPESAPPAPVSATSISRHQAEQAVRAAGGIVLRPFYTYGDGDRWFVPALLRWLHRRPAVWMDRGLARQSVVSVEALAAVVAAAALRPDAFGGSPFHVCEPEPVQVRDALIALAHIFGLPRPRISMPTGAARAALRLGGLRDVERQLELFTVEHTYQSGRAWQAAGVSPGPPMLDRLGRYAAWYQPFAQPTRRRGTS